VAARINGFSLAYTAAGGVILWSGIKGETLSATFRGLLSGKAPASDQQPIAGPASASDGAGGTGTTTIVADTGAATASAAANQALARLLAPALGHPGWISGTEWSDWVALWNQESGWSATAVNTSSGATGIPQLNPASHTIPPDWSSPTVQITWGINYIAGTYGDPVAAWAHEKEYGWY
jgi:hypothetical protein